MRLTAPIRSLAVRPETTGKWKGSEGFERDRTYLRVRLAGNKTPWRQSSARWLHRFRRRRRPASLCGLPGSPSACRASLLVRLQRTRTYRLSPRERPDE